MNVGDETASACLMLWENGEIVCGIVLLTRF